MKARIILAGGLIEGLLLDRLLAIGAPALAAKAAEKDRRQFVKPLDEWHLAALIDVARELNVISEDAKKHSATIREYRNLVHPGLERRSSIAVREQVANIAIEVLELVIADLKERRTLAAAASSSTAPKR